MPVELLTLADRSLAYQRQVGGGETGVIFLGGYASDMNGSKAAFLSQRCADRGVSFVRFDYRGCGLSPGAFTDGTIGGWLADSQAVFDRLTQGPQIIVGSSMGGWLGLLVARARRERARAFIGIAAAPDFTEDLIWDKLTITQRETLRRDGAIYDDNAPPDRRIPMTLRLIEEARSHLILRAPFSLPCPLRLLQGTKDSEVPCAYARRIAEHIAQPDTRVSLIENGDHRLNQPENLDLLWHMVAEFL